MEDLSCWPHAGPWLSRCAARAGLIPPIARTAAWNQSVADSVTEEKMSTRWSDGRRGGIKTRYPLPQIRGTVHVQYRVCGRQNCRCRRGERHAAYYLFWRQAGKLRKRYIRSEELEATRAACEARRRRQQAWREAERAAQASWRALVGYVRDIERRE